MFPTPTQALQEGSHSTHILFTPSDHLSSGHLSTQELPSKNFPEMQLWHEASDEQVLHSDGQISQIPWIMLGKLPEVHEAPQVFFFGSKTEERSEHLQMSPKP